MPTEVEYALMAGHAYRTTRDEINWIPVPQGWTPFSHVPDPATPSFPTTSGFEAISFQRGAEIVISYAGTDPADLLGDIAADIGLATGVGSAQLLQAAEYYLQVQAANPTANITFTGHSLGGGLAALMGVFFGKRAVTFDQAPFANSAELNVLTPNVAANLKADLLTRGYSDAALQGLTDFLALRDATGGIPNSSLVDSINVQGEFLSGVPWNIPDRIGIPVTIPNSAPDVSGFDLHSQALLTAFVQSIQTAAPQQTLHDVTFKLTDLMGMIFSNSLFARSTGTANTTERNFLERLVQNETGNAMVTRFTDDLWKLAKDGGLTIADDPTAATNLVSKALTAFAMQMYYENTANAVNANKELFTEVTGGVQFDRADVAATLDQAKGYNLYFQNYLNSPAFTDTELQLIQSLLPALRDWYVQAGASGMNATDTLNRGAFLLGGNDADSLTGGTQADVLVGNAGIDTLDGRGGNDVLLGGPGFDTYVYNTGEGTDRIEDPQGQNAVLFDQHLLQGGIRRVTDPVNTYRSPDGRFSYVQSGSDLIVNGSLTIKDWQPGQFGIRLFGEADYAPVTRTEFQKIDHYIQVGNAPDGTPLFEPVYAPFFDDNGNNTQLASWELGALTPPIGNENNLIHALGGNDTVISGEGDDQLYGDDGDDRLEGSGGHDRLYGGAGNDTINGDTSFALTGGNDYLDGGEGDDLLLGNAGSDVILGGAGNDNLNGDDGQAETAGSYGTDFLYGGDGDDELHGAGGADVLVGGSGQDLLIGDTTQYQGGTPEVGGGDALDGGDGDDQLFGLYGDDVLSGGLGHDLVNGQDGNDVLYGGDGNDTLSGDLRVRPANGLYDTAEHRGAGGNDLLDGGAGIDFLYGGEGDDFLRGGADNDSLYGDYNPSRFPVSTYMEIAGGNDTLNGIATVWGNDVLDGGEGNDELYGGDGNDILSGRDGDDALYGGDGVDRLDGGAGVDILDGGFGDDELHGGDGNDYLVAGLGNDALYGEDGDDRLSSGTESGPANSILDGGSGNDTYVIDSASDTVLESAGNGIDTVETAFDYVLPENVENLTVSGGYTGTGNALDNVLRGPFQSRLDGRAGNDTLVDAGTYVFGRGYAHDTIIETDTSSTPYFPGGAGDTIEFAADVLPDQVSWQRSGNDLILNITGSTDTLTIPSFYTVLFNQGGYLFSSNLYVPDQIINTIFASYYVAPAQVERVQFVDGTIWGPDTFDAPMIGAYYANSYTFGRGDGQDSILDFDFTGEGARDVLQIGTGVLPSDITVSRVGDNLLLGINDTSDQLTVQSHFASVFVRPFFLFSGKTVSAYQLEQVQFTDGTLWDAAAINSQIRDITGTEAADFLQGNANDNTIRGLGGDDTLHGQQGADVLDGGLGNDQLFGGEGSDTYLFGRGAGHDYVVDFDATGSDVEAIRLGAGISPSDVTVQAGEFVGDLDLMIHGTPDKMTWGNFFSGFNYHIDQVVFEDGTVWDTQALLAHGTGRAVVGTDDADVLVGSPFNDVLDGLGGDDYLIGDAGADTLSGGEGSDLLDGGAGNDTLWGGPSGIGGSGEGGGGEEGPAATVEALDEGGEGSLGGFGADFLIGGAGHDTYLFNLGDGIDTIEDVAAAGEGNRIQFGAGIAQADLTFLQEGTVLTIQVGVNGDAIRLTNFDPSNVSGSLVVETLAFDDGSQVGLAGLLGPTITEGDDIIATGAGDQTIDAKGGNDTVDTGADNDQLTGGTGNDQLAGGSGDDTYVFNLGDGVDTITDTALPGEGNTLSFGPGIAPADLSLGVGSLLVQVGPAGEAIHLTTFDPQNVYGPHTVETFRFADGTTLSYRQLLDRGFDLTGTAGDDTMTGTNVVDRITGLGGNDLLQSGDGDDVLDGGVGADRLIGGAGHDTYVIDESGDLVIEGVNEGTDTVHSSITYTIGANVEHLALTGTDAINGIGNELSNVLTGNSAANLLDGQSGADRLLGGKGDDTYVVDDPNDVVIEQAEEGTDTVLSTVSYRLGANVEHLTLTGSTAINGTGNALDNVLTGNLEANVLDGGEGADVLVGGRGDDVLDGGTGDDTYRYQLGDGLDRVSDGAGADTVQFGPGISFDSTVVRLMEAAESTTAHLRLLDEVGNELTDQGLDIRLGAGGTSPIEQFTFADGRTVALSDLVIETRVTEGTRRGDVIRTGRHDDVIYAGKGGDTIYAGSGHDTVYAGKGGDRIYGEAGHDCLYGEKGQDLLDGGSGDDVLDGGNGNDTLIGGPGTDRLLGGKGKDTLDGGPGDDLLDSGEGDDTIRFGRGDGHDQLIGRAHNHGDRVLFGTGIGIDHLWFTRTGNDLNVDVLGASGSADRLTITDWYDDKRNRVDEFRTADGFELEAKQVDQLRQAMAALAPPTLGSDLSLPPELSNQLAPELAAAWDHA